jgi:hypothetical protein
MATSSPLCPLCQRPNCPSLLNTGSTCGPAVERRGAGSDRRETERRFFPRPEGRRRNAGRRRQDPAG